MKENCIRHPKYRADCRYCRLRNKEPEKPSLHRLCSDLGRKWKARSSRLTEVSGPLHRAASDELDLCIADLAAALAAGGRGR